MSSPNSFLDPDSQAGTISTANSSSVPLKNEIETEWDCTLTLNVKVLGAVKSRSSLALRSFIIDEVAGSKPGQVPTRNSTSRSWGGLIAVNLGYEPICQQLLSPRTEHIAAYTAVTMLRCSTVGVSSFFA